MTTNIDDDVLDRLEAEATVADAGAEELTIAVESDIQEMESQVEELEQKIDERDAEVEQLQQKLEEKDERIDEMSEEVNAVAEDYAEELAADSEALSKDDFIDKFEFEELREKYNELEPDSSPNARSGDPGAGFRSPDEGVEEEGDETDVSEQEELAASSFRKRARETGNDYWIEIAEDIEEGE